MELKKRGKLHYGEHNKKESMKKRKVIILSIEIIVIALLLEASILKYVNDKNAYRTSQVLLDRVVTVLDKNDKSKAELIGSLKDDYIVRAKAVSYIIDAKPEVEYDVEELQKIAKLMAIDEIHLFDEQGYIYSGSLPKYFGYSFNSGTQMGYFKPMLENKSLTMCQDVTPNTSEGKEMMYAITWNEDGTKMIQVGIEPKRLLKEECRYIKVWKLLLRMRILRLSGVQQTVIKLEKIWMKLGCHWIISVLMMQAQPILEWTENVVDVWCGRMINILLL